MKSSLHDHIATSIDLIPQFSLCFFFFVAFLILYSNSTIRSKEERIRHLHVWCSDCIYSQRWFEEVRDRAVGVCDQGMYEDIILSVLLASLHHVSSI